MNEEQLALDNIWRGKIIAKIDSQTKRLNNELEALQAYRERVAGGEALPMIDRNSFGQFVWFCPGCNKQTGKNIFPTNIPFKKDAYCKECAGKTSHDLTEVME